MVRGVFITVEGGEGTGKSTQAEHLGSALREAGLRVVQVREPGGTRLGEGVRALLLDRAHDGLEPRAELLLYEAARAELTRQVIMPTLASGGAVVCDRYYDSTTAYQGYGRGLPLDEIANLNAFAAAGLVPDLTIVLDLDPALGLKRATSGVAADRLESESLEFHERVRDGFLQIAKSDPERVAVVSADGSPDEVAARMLDAVRRIPVLAAVLH
ncbi:MAG: dTMP kinase [Coriobacteriia bacterium]|jgi:dTMP kinase|nr:dTMP kinase [Coriobacteriia bacterium]